MMTKKIWLFITDAQPGLHAGHIDGIKQAVQTWITKVIVWVGAADARFTSDHPFTYDERKHMIKLSAQASLPDIEVEVFPIPNFWDDSLRRKYILSSLPEFQYLVTGNTRTQNIFKDTDKTIVPLEMRQVIRSSTIRGQLVTRKFGELEKVFPSSVMKYFDDISAFHRLRELFNNERKTPSLVVDVVPIDPADGMVVLIERKFFPFWIALPGGFNDFGERGSEAGEREGNEETGYKMKIIRELWVRDHPDRDPRNHNVSRAFEAEIIGGEMKAATDAKRVIKIAPKDLDTITNWAFRDHKEMILKALEGKYF